MQKRPADVIIAGYLCLDIVPELPFSVGSTISDIFQPGKSILIGESAVCTGGPVSNAGMALARLGHTVVLMSQIGDDDFGRIIMSRLSSQADVSRIKINSEQTSAYAIALAPPGIDRFFLYNPGATQSFGVDDIDFAMCEKAKIFLLGYPPAMRRLYQNEGEELVTIFQSAKKRGSVTALDMTQPAIGSEAEKIDWKNVLRSVLPYVDIFLPSIEETLLMIDQGKYKSLQQQYPGKDILDHLSGSDLSRLSSLLCGWGATIVGLKCGHKGVYLRTGEEKALTALVTPPGNAQQWSKREIWAPAFYIDHLASATGSGDSAVAGFLAAYLRNESPERAVRYANALGYQNLTALDALSGIKDWDATTEIVEDLERETLFLEPGNGWRFSPEEIIWHGPDDVNV